MPSSSLLRGAERRNDRAYFRYMLEFIYVWCLESVEASSVAYYCYYCWN